MSDTNQEDLSVEDILSSIKDILTDDGETASQEQDSQENSIPQVSISTPTEETPDDVFDLDTSMIVNEDVEISDILEESTQETSPNLADSIDIEQTLNLAENMDISNIPGLENLLEENTSEETETPTEVKEETIDASANIINNFAKLFAEKQQEQNTANSEISEKVIDSIKDQNITDMVKEAIINQTKLCLDSHFEKIASNIIAEQTKLWLNSNLSSIVEKTVAKEIERVIAKVGS